MSTVTHFGSLIVAKVAFPEHLGRVLDGGAQCSKSINRSALWHFLNLRDFCINRMIDRLIRAEKKAFLSGYFICKQVVPNHTFLSLWQYKVTHTGKGNMEKMLALTKYLHNNI